jgi:hypothetical protein
VSCVGCSVLTSISANIGVAIFKVKHLNLDRPAKRYTWKTNHRAYFPYIEETTDCISRLLQEHNTHMIQKPVNRMTSRFSCTKDGQLLTQKLDVYSILYPFGKTGLHTFTRTTELIRYTRLENQQSAIAKQSTATRHNTEFDKTEVIANISSYHPRIIRKAVEISMHPHPL